MTAMWATLDLWGFAATRYLLEALWQSTLAFCAVAVLSLALRRYTRARHTLWLLALIVAPALPLLADLVEPILPQQSVANFPVYTSPGVRGLVPAVASAHSAAIAVDVSRRSITGPAQTPLDYPWALALLAYAFGASLFLAWTLLGHLRIHQWIRSGRAATEPSVVEAFERAAERLKVRGPVWVMLTERVPAPLTAGSLHPTVLLPNDIATTFTPDDLYAVALHETIHVQQREPLILTLASLIRCALFFHPLVWVACRRLAVYAEHTADDAVLEITGAPVVYAKLITTFAERLPLRTPAIEGAAGLVFCRSVFLKRVEAILGDRVRVRRLTRLTLACTVTAVLLSLATALALPLSSDRNPGASPKATTTRVAQSPAAGFGGVAATTLVDKTKPNAQDIFEAYSLSQDKLVGFAAHYQWERRWEGKLDTIGGTSGSSTEFHEGWACQDFSNQRTICREKVWGQQGVGFKTSTKDQALYRIYRWANGAMHQYCTESQSNCIVTTPKDTRRFYENPLTLLVYFPGATALGYADGDYRRMDKKLMGANLVLRPQMERVGESLCHVIEADTCFGLITAWFDPTKDYALAKYTIEQGPGDIERENLTVAQTYKMDGITKRREVTIEKLVNANGVWLPAKFTVNAYTSLPGGDYHKHTGVTTIDTWYANPDFEAMRAFELSEVPDESIWSDFADNNTFYRWNGGNLEVIANDFQAMLAYGKAYPPANPVPWQPVLTAAR